MTADLTVRPAPTSPRGLAALAQAGDRASIRAGLVLEPKLDGVRLLAWVPEAGGCRLYTRNGTEVSKRLPHVRDALADALPPGSWLDGEAVFGSGEQGGTWREVQSVLTSTRNPRDPSGVTFAVFDVIALGGTDARPAPLEDRRRLLEGIFERLAIDTTVVRLVPQLPATVEAHDRCLELGFEGSIVKDPRRPYPTARRGSWRKVKPQRTDEWVILGLEDAKADSSWAGLVGAIRFGGFDAEGALVEVGTCSGFDMTLRRAMTARPERYLGRVIEVASFPSLTDGTPRSPQFKGFREDKDPVECRADFPPVRRRPRTFANQDRVLGRRLLAQVASYEGDRAVAAARAINRELPVPPMGPTPILARPVRGRPHLDRAR